MVKVVTVNAAAGDPEPESLVKTFPVAGVSSAVVLLSLIIVTLLLKIKRAGLDVTFPQAKFDWETCKR